MAGAAALSTFDRDSPLNSPTWQELRQTAKLAIPVVAAQVGMMAMGMVDVMMIGRVSTEAIAAVALGHVFTFGLVIIGLGALQALDPLISQALGAGDQRALGTHLQRGLVLAALFSVPACALSWPAGPVLTFLQQPADVVPIAESYIHASVPGLPPFLVFVVLRQTLQAFSRTAPIVWTTILANLANVLFNWVLIFGEFGFPEMGATGCAWATTACRWLLVASVLALGWKDLRGHLLPLRREAAERGPLLRMFRLGLPIGLGIALEYGAFMATALMMGHIGEREVASHQVAITLASFSFMFPLGIGAAAAVRVGYAVGRSDPAGARLASTIAVCAGALIMTLSGVLFLAFPEPLARLFTDKPEVVEVAALLIPLAGVFQVFDGVQAVASGVLRGLGDTRTPFKVHLFGFWVLGIPLGWYLAFEAGAGPRGLWWGLVVGLGVAAVILLARIHFRLRAGVERVVVD